MSKYEVRREVQKFHRPPVNGMRRPSVEKVKYVVYRDGESFSQYERRYEAEECVRQCEMGSR
jgi:hypothetical protein